MAEERAKPTNASWKYMKMEIHERHHIGSTLAASSLFFFSKALILSWSARVRAGDASLPPSPPPPPRVVAEAVPLLPLFSVSSAAVDFSSRASRRVLHSAKERTPQCRQRREPRRMVECVNNC